MTLSAMKGAGVARALYFGCVCLCSFAAWALPTVRMSRDIQYFLKTGLYNKEQLFSSPRLSLFLIGALAVACLANATGAGRSSFQWVRSFLGVALTGVLATIAALYILIYFDLIMARLWGPPTADFTILLLLAFEGCLLAGMFLILSIFGVPEKAGGSFSFLHRLFASLCATGLAKTILLLTAHDIPLWGLSQLTCDGPCLT